jgi:hypothetical protein
VYLKLMEGGGGFRVISVSEVSFRRLPEPKILYKNGTVEEKEVALSNDAYLLNENGDTIEFFVVRGRR